MATEANDVMFFDGVTGQLTVTLINPYTGESISVDEQKNINRGVYDGLGGVDILLMTNLGDALFIRNELGNQVVANVETFLAGDGGDVIALADATLILGDVTMFGGQGDDILWSNNGNDTVYGSSGDDIINGGGGNDFLSGDTDNDTIRGGDGDDVVDGGAGNDTLYGGNGADNIVYTSGNDTIVELADGALDIITMAAGITLADIAFSNTGDDLIVTVAGKGAITIVGQYVPDAGIDRIVFSDNSYIELPRAVAPVATDDNFTGNEDTIISGNVLTNDTDANNDALSVVAGTFTTVNGGQVVLMADGWMTYTPAANYFGSDSFNYTVSDTHGLQDTGSVTITINSVNDNPLAVDDNFVGDEDTAVSGNVLVNDTDLENDALSVIAGTITTVHGGTVVLAVDGSFTYTPAADFHGSDSFDYTLQDAQGGSDLGTVNLTVDSVNDAPFVQDDAFSGDEDMSVSGNVLMNDSDSDGGSLTVVAATITTVHNGTVTLLANGDFTYVPAANYFGADSFNYTLLDGQGGSNLGTVNLTINSINDGPVAGDDAFTGNEDTVITGNLLGNDSDIDGGVLSVTAGTYATAHGNVTILANGDFTYTPNADYFGADSFNYTLLDGQGGSDLGLVSLTLNDVADGSVIVGTNGHDTINGTNVDDYIDGLDGKDVIYGHVGNDYIVGGNGNDTLYGGSNTATLSVDKSFAGSILFPNVMETVNIHNLLPPGDPAVGIQSGNLNVEHSMSALVTRQASASGYNSTLGYYAVGANGEIIASQVLWTNMNAVAVGATKTIDVSAAGENGEIGFFIIANGANVNNYSGLNITGEDVLHFYYDYGLSTQRAATINDEGSHISLVYNDGHTARVLQGPMYFTTERGGDADLNYDNRTHVISGLTNVNNTDVLRIGFEDLPGLGDADYQDVVFDLNFNAVQQDVSEPGNDVLIGGAGNDKLYGEAGNDILVGGEGNDKLYGGDGSDQFIFNDVSEACDEIYGFETGVGGDVVNITDVLSGYDALSDAIDDFVRLVQHGNSTKLQVNVDGIGNDFKVLAVFDAVITDSVQTLVNNGNLVLDQHVNI